MIRTIQNDDLGRPSTPGHYEFGGATIRVERKHIAAWDVTPDVAFKTILCTRMGDTNLRFDLGDRVGP